MLSQDTPTSCGGVVDQRLWKTIVTKDAEIIQRELHFRARVQVSMVSKQAGKHATTQASKQANKQADWPPVFDQTFPRQFNHLFFHISILVEHPTKLYAAQKKEIPFLGHVRLINGLISIIFG